MKTPCKNCGGVCCKWLSIPFQGPIESYQANDWITTRCVLDPIKPQITVWNIPSKCQHLDDDRTLFRV